MIEQTPGPWEVTRGTGERLRVVDASHNVPCIATVHGRNGNVEADARLIAAAPDLLDALREMIEAIPLDDFGFGWAPLINAKRVARAAIAKAEGELEVDGDEA